MTQTLRSAWIALILLAVSVGEVSAQSFDCAKATTADEKAVCASPALSKLDSEMATLYDAIEQCALMGTRGDVQDSQRAFLAKRADCGADDACLTTLYTTRVAQLAKIRKDVGKGAC